MVTKLCVLENYDQHLEFSLGFQQNSLNENGCLTPLKLVSILRCAAFPKKGRLISLNKV